MKSWLALVQTLMEYRHCREISHQLQKIRERHSMLHQDVLILIYHFAKMCAGDVLDEIGPYLGESTIAAAFGVRDSESTIPLSELKQAAKASIRD